MAGPLLENVLCCFQIQKNAKREKNDGTEAKYHDGIDRDNNLASISTYNMSPSFLLKSVKTKLYSDSRKREYINEDTTGNNQL